jgi:hypothetical protein
MKATTTATGTTTKLIVFHSLTFARLLKVVPKFMETELLFMFTGEPSLAPIMNQIDLVRTIHHLSLRSVLILSSHLHPGLPFWLSHQNPICIHILFMRSVCPAHRIPIKLYERKNLVLCTEYLEHGLRFAVSVNEDIYHFITILFVFVGYLTMLFHYRAITSDDGMCDAELDRIWKQAVVA